MPTRWSRYPLRSPQLTGRHRMARTEERSHSLLVTEQRTMSSLFFLLISKHLQLELCHLIWCRTRPVTLPQEGRLHSGCCPVSPLRHSPPHLPHSPSSSYFVLIPSPSLLCFCCLLFNQSLIPRDCLFYPQQNRCTALPLSSEVGTLNLRSGLNASK